MSTVIAQHADPALPGLHIALESDALLDALRQRLPECRDQLQLLDAKVADVQYTPGAGAQVLWKLRAHDLETGRTGRQLVYVRALRRGASPPARPRALIERYARRRATAAGAQLREMPLRTPWLFMLDALLLVHAFPLDPVLPTLMDVTDPEAMKVALQRAWQPRHMRVRHVRADTLSYTPEARAALSFRVLAEHKGTGMPELRSLVGKLHGTRTPARLFAGHWAVWRGSGGHGVAPPAGYVSLAQLSLQEFLPGRRLSDFAGRSSFLGYVRRSAHAIARIHSLTVPVLATRGLEKELASVDRWAGILSRLRPAHADRLERLRLRLHRELAERIRITGTVHADFHLANVLAEHDRVTIIDWDQAAHGDPMVDVGRVLASLRVSSLRVHGRLDGFADVEAGFLDAYLAHTGGDEGRARLFEAASLLISAAGPFRLQRSGWEEGAELMLDEVDRILDLSVRGPRLPGTPPAQKRQVPFSARAVWALDPTYAQALLVPVVHAAHGADIEVTECAGRLDKQAEGPLHVRWLLKGYRGRDRWRGTIEGVSFEDQSGRGLLRRLELAQPTASGALLLPRPLGYLEPLCMIAFEPPAGDSLHALLGGPDEASALQTLADGLARFQALELDLGKERETQRDIDAVDRRVRRLEESGHPAAATARSLLDAVRPRIEALGERRAATVCGLDLHRLRVSDAGAGAALLDDLVLAEPLLNAATLLVRLRLRTLRQGAEPAAGAALARAYASAAGESLHALAACEALLLLRRVCSAALLDASDPLVTPMLRDTRRLLEQRP
jgi:hypothetical protein